MESILRANGLAKRYEAEAIGVEALRGIDFEVRRGEFVAIMGPSGSGKSTLLHLIGGLDRPSAGEVVLAGQPLAALSDRDLTLLRRRRVGVVFQFFNLLPTLTAEENVALPLMLDGLPGETCRSRAAEALAVVGLGERAGRLPHQLSGGEQQRVAIARALVARPALLLADEPTGNLDSASGAQVLDALRRASDEGQTVVMVTHDPGAAARANRVVFLQDGRVVDELRGPGLTAPQIVDAQAARRDGGG
jgi:putative ABC transport system ATP-binding protein